MENKKEHGSIILESTYCILISIIIVMFFMSFGFFLYQKTMVTIVANEVAEEVSLTYKLRSVSDSSLVTVDDVSGVGKYRYMFFANRFNDHNETKAENIANVRLTKASLAEEEGSLFVDVEMIVDDIGRRHYEVTVRQEYSFLFGDLLSFVGLNDAQVLEETVYVESHDVLNYVNTVKATKYGIDKAADLDGGLGLENSMVTLVKKTISLLKTIFEG